MHDFQFFPMWSIESGFFYLLFFFYYFPLKLKTETSAITKKNHKMLPTTTTANICILAFLNMINIYSFISNITKLWIHDIETQHHINTFSLCCFFAFIFFTVW